MATALTTQPVLNRFTVHKAEPGITAYDYKVQVWYRGYVGLSAIDQMVEIEQVGEDFDPTFWGDTVQPAVEDAYLAAGYIAAF